jgi:phosphocarrier protein FPr
LETILTVRSLHGLHARPAAKFVQTAASFNAEVKVKNLSTNKGPVSAKSLNAIATLGVLKDHQIKVFAAGAQSEQAVKALTRLVEDNFGEPLVVEQAPAKAEPKLPKAAEDERAQVFVPISEGLAIGPIAQFVKKPITVPEYKVEDPAAEWERFEAALEIVKKAVAQRRQELTRRVGEADASILDAHLLILEDPELLEKMRQQIYQEHDNAAAAWNRFIQELVESYRALPDEYMQQRALDVQGIGDEVLLELVGETPEISIRLDEPVILFAENITPTETSQLNLDQVLGLVTVGGGPTSHSAILARALGIPALSGADPKLAGVAEGTTVVIDGFTVNSGLTRRRTSWRRAPPAGGNGLKNARIC